jgi:PLP dependent protein
MDAYALKSIQRLLHKFPNAPEIVAVSKTHPFSAIQDVYALGIRHIGENRLEEASEKIAQAKRIGFTDIVWHMIGHVQSRKIRDVVRLFDRIDSVDSAELFQKINTEAKNIGKIMHVLLEINISGEESKYGFRDFDVSMLQSFDASNVVIDGLMTMAPYTEIAETNRAVFRSLRQLSMSLRKKVPHIGGALSMGTSCDWLVAVEEGATEIRLGEALFGVRKKLHNQ